MVAIYIIRLAATLLRKLLRIPAIFLKIFQDKLKDSDEQHDHVDVEPLYAFRTIITMLSLLQAKKESPEDSEPSSKEVKIVDALASIINREHGVAAVVAKPPDGSGTIQVIVAVTEPRYHPQSKNINPTIPGHLSGINKPGDLVEAFLMHDWYKPDEETFETHIWMLAKLLEQQDDPHSVSVLYYVIAACYEKFILRLTHRVSNHYRAALENVPTFQLPAQVSFPPAKATELKCDSLFQKLLSRVKPHLGIEILKLLEQVDSRDLYSGESCNEFHQVLCKLLTIFSDALRKLGKLRKERAGVVEILDQLKLVASFGVTLRTMIGGAAMKKHLKVIEKFLPDRTALARQTEVGHDRPRKDEVANGDADSEFQSFQLDHPTLAKACNDWLELMVIHFDDVQRLVDHVQSANGSTIVIQIVTQLPPDRYMLPWKTLLSCKAYFPDDRLFPVADIIGFLDPIADFEPAASIAENFLDPTGNPTSIADTDNHQKISAETLVQSLKEIGKIPTFVLSADGSRWNLNLEAFNKAIGPIIEKVRRRELTNCTSIGWEDHTDAILSSLVAFQSTWTDEDEDGDAEWYRSLEIRRIVEMIETMRDNAKLHRALKRGAALSTGIGFTGNHHAEAILAAYCHLDAPGSKTTKVSKRCCPVCAFLLRILEQKLFTNQHQTISSCALPHGLPNTVITLMIQTFGGELIRSLNELRWRTKTLQRQASEEARRDINPGVVRLPDTTDCQSAFLSGDGVLKVLKALAER